jgi:GDP-L-fucose synthase
LSLLAGAVVVFIVNLNNLKYEMIDLSKKRIILTGGAGFLGRFVEKKLIERGCSNIFIPRIEEYDLRNLDDIVKIYQLA